MCIRDSFVDSLEGTLRYVKAKQRSKHDVYLSWDEWQVWYKGDPVHGNWTEAPHLSEETYNLEDALVVAQWLNVFLRKSQVLKIACVAQIVNVISWLNTRGDEMLKQTEAENLALKNDLGFFERLLPAAAGESALSIRGLQAEAVTPGQLRYQLLLMQTGKSRPEFSGRYEMTLSGTLEGRPWSLVPPGGTQPLQVRQYRRVEGLTPQPLGAELARRPWVLRDGPERIESGWWDGKDVRRDYFVAESPSGARVWLYRDGRGGFGDGEWFAHGPVSYTHLTLPTSDLV